VDHRFATASTAGTTGVPDTGFRGAVFRLDGNCTFAESTNGHRTFLVWPEGHVRFDPETRRVWYLDIFGKKAVVFREGQRLNIRATYAPRDTGYRPLNPDAFAVPPHPSCPDDDVALVTGITVL
jgi:hypothetical protein